MRVIKFRMWNITSKKYHYDVENVFQSLAQQNVHDSVMPTRGFTVAYDHIAEGCVFEQFTGLKDKNGKDIYEGDVVKGVGVTSCDKPVIRAVAFCEKSARFGLTDANGNITFEPLQWISFPLEIIGNIHQQKE